MPFPCNDVLDDALSLHDFVDPKSSVSLDTIYAFRIHSLTRTPFAISHGPVLLTPNESAQKEKSIQHEHRAYRLTGLFSRFMPPPQKQRSYLLWISLHLWKQGRGCSSASEGYNCAKAGRISPLVPTARLDRATKVESLHNRSCRGTALCPTTYR